LAAFGAALVYIISTAWAHPKPGAHADVRFSIDDDAVRCQTLMNILFVDQLVNSPRARRDEVTDEEAEPLQQAVAEYFGAGRTGPVRCVVDKPNRVMIDGVEVAPVIRELRVVHPPEETPPGFIQNPVLLLPQVYAVVEYPCKSPPKTVSLVWGTYVRDFIAADRDAAPIVDVEAVLTAKGRLDLVTFRKAEPEYVWHAPADAQRLATVPPPVVEEPPLRLPGGAIAVGVAWGLWLVIMVMVRRAKLTSLAAGTAAFGAIAAAAGAAKLFMVTLPARDTATPISESEARAIFEPLHANVYRAFDYSRESDIYDALARSVDGPMLDSIYNDVYRGLVMQEEGGALSRVKSVDHIESQAGSTPAPTSKGFTIRSKWRVQGVVYHWGHSHSRTNEYVAEYTIAARAAGWRIVGVVPLEQRRIEGDAQANSGASVNALPGAASPSAPEKSNAQVPAERHDQ
jgi:hypothetical protein